MRMRPPLTKGVEMRELATPAVLKRVKGMKIRHPLSLGLVVAVAVSLASVAVASAAQTPFKGTLDAVETSQFAFPIASIDREGTGTATHLGKYTEHVTQQVNVLTMSSTG